MNYRYIGFALCKEAKNNRVETIVAYDVECIFHIEDDKEQHRAELQKMLKWWFFFSFVLKVHYPFFNI